MQKRWKLALGIVALLLVIVVLPVLYRQIRPIPRRQLEGVRLADVTYREVAFRNESAGLDLAGMLFVPEGEGPFPAAVIIHGSGTSRRDNSWYLTLAKDLVDSGIVVLLPDKRGSEKSQGDWHRSSLMDLADDTAAAVRYLREQSQVPISKVGIVGMSQGGHIAPLAAERAKDIAFVVNLVGSVTPLREGLVYEETHNLRQMGLLPGVADGVAWLSTSYLVNVSQREFWDAIGEDNPLPHWKKLQVPALVLYGAEDTNVDTAENARLLRSLDRENLEVVVYEGSGHALEDPEGAGIRIIRQEVLERVRAFVQQAAAAE